MNAEKEVQIFGSKWQVEVHMFGVNFAVRLVCQSAPQNVGGVNCHLVANLGLRRGHRPKLQNKEHTIYGSLRAVANTQAQK